MSDSKLTDDEILALIGTPSTILFGKAPPGPEERRREKFYERVAECLGHRVELAHLREEFESPDASEDFLAALDEFIARASDAHECWTFCSPQAAWRSLAEYGGYALVIEGRVTDVLITIRN
ncbi:hypothetical protein [Blastopirellula marina]|uniref:Uncharacterized protein n=1 Tax=Blastopirellula marina DSM 3645 TaxID=314230 RepID=A4A215_9BACT|nr:hypothetical protein [Blastopirellula marina]EAQ77177.1 hypothetical protein DSM3645_13083 [Blastopirellula marina DSM 3645]